MIEAAIVVNLFRPISSHDWMRAEVATGALWGALVVAANSPWR